MPAFFPSGSDKMAKIRSLAARGDEGAEALMAFLDNTYYVAMTAAAEAANKIVVTGQVKDQDGQNVAGVKNVLLKSVPVSGAGGITDDGVGLIKFGSTTKEAWVQTDSTGKFQMGITNAVAEDNLVTAQLDNGTVEMLVLTFA